MHMRPWWNGIHSGLKIRRRKLEGSNPSGRTIKQLDSFQLFLFI